MSIAGFGLSDGHFLPCPEVCKPVPHKPGPLSNLSNPDPPVPGRLEPVPVPGPVSEDTAREWRPWQVCSVARQTRSGLGGSVYCDSMTRALP